MAKMNPPHSEAVIDVRDESVERYEAAGYTKVSASSETKKATTRKSSSRKTEK